jgi:hypothetical protein
MCSNCYICIQERSGKRWFDQDSAAAVGDLQDGDHSPNRTK